MTKERTKEEESWSRLVAGERVHIFRDGVMVATVADANAAFAWLLTNTNFSTSYALNHDGYELYPEGSP